MVFLRIKPGVNEELGEIGKRIFNELFKEFSYCIAIKSDNKSENMMEIQEDTEKIKEYLLSKRLFRRIEKECQKKFSSEPPIEFSSTGKSADWRVDFR